MSGADPSRVDVANLDARDYPFDAPNMTVRAINTKLDQVIDSMNAIIDALIASTNATDFRTGLLAASALSADLQKLKYSL